MVSTALSLPVFRRLMASFSFSANFSAHFPGCYIWAYISLGPSFWQRVQKIHFILKAETWILQNIHLNQNPSVHQISSSTFQPYVKYPPLCPFHPASLPLQKCQTSFQNTVPALHASFRSLAAAAPRLKCKRDKENMGAFLQASPALSI